MASVYRIDPIAPEGAAKLRVCAYARVSSNSEDQLNSFASQVGYYTHYIQAHEEWSLVDIYADEGITGTSTAKRDDFHRLMEDCRQGKIDRILVKSVSRFARNVQDCLEAVRELKQLGVTILFEKERIDTARLSSEMMLSMMSAFAQEESISTSKNLCKGAVMRMKNGKFRLSQAPYGFRLDESGHLHLHGEEAKVVQRIYNGFLSGMSIQEIASELKNERIPKLQGSPVWSYMGVRYILTNERYIGDQVFQKRYTSDTLPFKKKLNRGEKSQFYMTNTHEPIIPRELFKAAQNLLAEKSQMYGHFAAQVKYPFTSVLQCGECGTNFCRRVTKNGSIYWVCRRHLQDKDACKAESVPEQEIEEAFLVLYEKLRTSCDEILLPFSQQLSQLADRQALQRPESLQIQEKIAELLKQSHTLQQLRVRECVDSAFFMSRSNEIERELTELRKQLKNQRKNNQIQLMISSTDRMRTTLSRPLRAFRADVFHQMVGRVTILDAKLQFHMLNNLTFEESRKQ